ncbi:hypothetical protein BT96DRAFT_820107 [Gymnopus androsaceus JB14]|uniref:Uncharacterized protein n=1 Tax=Gymnopus androsaceus JB14 TaxID=1447944 RepID=A0A6A4HQ36_9AGAR|nr:hypothetical protein BT96DRAFT_820107 [Gymnopus androsaceus JB14]
MVPSLTWACTSLAIISCALSAFAGVISAPTSSEVVAKGDSFDFAYEDSNFCFDGYSQITVWLTDYAPTTANLNSTGEFDQGDYTYYFGSYLIANFGLPPLPPDGGFISPPTSLVMPELPSLVSGEEVYLAVVETGTECQPVSVTMTYSTLAI